MWTQARAAVLVLGALAAACAPTGTRAEWEVLLPEADTLATTRVRASVAHMDLEGGLYVLRTEDGTNYDPTNLPETYRVDGRRVEADVIRRDDVASIGMVGPIVDIVRIRSLEDGSGRTGGATPPGEPGNLWGSAWVLEDLAGRGVVDSATATLEFPEPGQVAGSASCNQFAGPVRVIGDSIAFGPLVATRRGCAPAVNDQETRFLRALEAAVTYRVDGPTLLIRAAGLAEPVRLARR